MALKVLKDRRTVILNRLLSRNSVFSKQLSSEIVSAELKMFCVIFIYHSLKTDVKRREETFLYKCLEVSIYWNDKRFN